MNKKKHYKCSYCGAPEHYAKGLCSRCYHRQNICGQLEYRGWRKYTEEEGLNMRLEREKRYRAENKEKISEAYKKYYQEHAEELRAKRRQRYQDEKAKMLGKLKYEGKQRIV